MKIIYLDYESEETAGLHEIEVEHLNNFHGANINHLQVLKSAAGYYIGSLSKADWHPDFWEPYMRDSQRYWGNKRRSRRSVNIRKV